MLITRRPNSLSTSTRKATPVVRASSSRTRGGLTLLEMLLASVILVTSLAALAQHNATGTDASLRSQLETEAAIRCQSQLNRLLVETPRIANSTDTAFTDDPRWHWSARKQPSKFPGLSLLTVDVYQHGTHRNISSFSLSRLCPDDTSTVGTRKGFAQ